MNESNNTDKCQTIPSITQEIDEPQSSISRSATVETKQLSEQQVKSLEEQKFEHGTKIDKWAVWVLVGCIFGFLCVYVFERLIGIWFDPSAELPGSNLSGVFTETLKFLISSLIGFLFAKRTI